MSSEEINKEFSEEKRKTIDEIRESEYSYWNALLAVNGVFIAVFSAISILSQGNQVLVFLIVFLSLIASALLIANFYDRRKSLHKVGKMFTDYSIISKETELSKEAALIHDRIHKREHWILILLIAQAIILLCISFPRLC